VVFRVHCITCQWVMVGKKERVLCCDTTLKSHNFPTLSRDLKYLYAGPQSTGFCEVQNYVFVGDTLPLYLGAGLRGK
jgi:hypothetical protein